MGLPLQSQCFFFFPHMDRRPRTYSGPMDRKPRRSVVDLIGLPAVLPAWRAYGSQAQEVGCGLRTPSAPPSCTPSVASVWIASPGGRLWPLVLPARQERSRCSPSVLQRARSAPTAVPASSSGPGALPLQSQRPPASQERSHCSPSVLQRARSAPTAVPVLFFPQQLVS